MSRTITTKRRMLGIIGAAALGLMVATPALAADSTDVVVTSGSLGAGAPTVTDFSAKQLDGGALTTTATLDGINVTDARGTGVGWHLTVQATQFVQWDYSGGGAGVAVVGGHALPAGSLSMEAVAASKIDLTSSTVPTTASGPYVIDSGSAVTVATAGSGEGMGSYLLQATDGATTLTLSLGADTYVGTYHSDVTVSAVTGP